MGGRAGGGASGGMGSGAAARELTAAQNQLLDAIQSGKFYGPMDYQKQLDMLDAADKGASKLNESRNIYSDAEWDALKAYEGGHFEKINDAARGAKKATEWDKQTIKSLDKAIGRRKLTKDIIVWRGSTAKESSSGRFVSTTLKASVSEKFNGGTKHLHAFKIPKGTHYLYTEGKGEAEVILPRGFNLSKYKIK